MAYTDIDDPKLHHETLIYTGTGADRNIGGLDFQPDWVWIKRRTGGNANGGMFDSVRGVTKLISSSQTDGEQTIASSLKSFRSDGFSLGSGDSGYVNQNSGKTYVAWNWKAGTTFTNDASSTSVGDIDSLGSVNANAGFSIIKATSDGAANKDIAHGLGAVPDMIISKNLERGYNWDVYFKTLGYNAALQLNSTAAVRTGAWGSNTFTTTTFETYEDYSSKSGEAYIYYCFAEKKGYSKFGSYIANSNVNGAFAYLGFKPAFLIIKNTSQSTDWIMYDNKRDGFEPQNKEIRTNASAAERNAEDNNVQFCANGFKTRNAGTKSNADSGDLFVYMAFAEQPLVTSTGVPATAR